jgi:putative ABC transport system substrate-binding protein
MLMRTALTAVFLMGVVAGPLVSGAQEAGKVARLGVVVVSESESPPDPNILAFRQGLRELGYVEGQNLVVDYRYAHGRADRAPGLVAELIALKVDVIVAAGPTALAARNATRTIPIVCVAAGDPVRFGLVASLARPGGNVTGLALIVDESFVGKWMDLLVEAAPRITRVGYLHDTHMALPGPDLGALGPKLRRVEVRALSDLDRAFAEIGKQRGGLIVPPAPFFLTHRGRIPELAAKHRVPAVYGFPAFADAGGLMSYGLDLRDVWRRATTYVDKILRGAQPRDLPVEQPTKHELVVNLRTAKNLGLTIPASLLLRADRVIE